MYFTIPKWLKSSILAPFQLRSTMIFLPYTVKIRVINNRAFNDLNKFDHL